jgi:hypothetical protein
MEAHASKTGKEDKETGSGRLGRPQIIDGVNMKHGSLRMSLEQWAAFKALGGQQLVRSHIDSLIPGMSKAQRAAYKDELARLQEKYPQCIAQK